MGILFAWISGLSASLFSYLMRKSIDRGGSSAIFTFLQLFICILVTIFVGPIRTESYSWSTPIALLGGVAGVFFGLLFLALGKALERGPSSLMFACVNSACVMPALLMFFIFGNKYGFNYTLWHALGAFFVIVGLFWSGLQASKKNVKGKWLPFALGSFVLQVLFLSSLQFRSMHLSETMPTSPLFLSVSIEEAKTEWFLPMLFLGATLVQIISFLFNRKLFSKIDKGQLIFGALGGITNGFSLFTLTLATEYATSKESLFLFPTSAVTIIIVCSAWGQILYKEKVNWYANSLCALGVLVSVYG